VPKAKILTAALVATGDELLWERSETNGAKLAQQIRRYGLQVMERIIIPDDESIICQTIARVIKEHALVVVIGGLGPTSDDVTRQATARALAVPLVFNNRAWRDIQARFHKMKRRMAEINRIQAMIPYGAKVLQNHWGTAPGFLSRHHGHWLMHVPGPPAECLPMFQTHGIPLLKSMQVVRTVIPQPWSGRICGMGESDLQERLTPIAEQYPQFALGFLLDEPGEILISLKPKQIKISKREYIQCIQKIKTVLGENQVGPGNLSLEQIINDLLCKNEQTVSVAESCTGGWISRRLTRLPDSSKTFLAGVVSYSNQAKINYLGVTPRQLTATGAVSESVARAMARGVQKTNQSHWSIAVTGIAGPSGGTKKKPVGTVCLAWANPQGQVDTQSVFLLGHRDLIQRRAATLALDGLRRRILRNN
jgi:nicotinamide-nucleotide amidase